MDRNSIIGLVLIAAILIGYQIYTAPSPEQVAQMQREQDSLAQVEIQQKERQAQQAQVAQEATATGLPSRPVDSLPWCGYHPLRQRPRGRMDSPASRDQRALRRLRPPPQARTRW
ncbi:MAG: hypothetical protein IPN38_20580 [Flavobacteriales bacterium]|nr:hypothetical protein [Flavobacteriales bacterium]